MTEQQQQQTNPDEFDFAPPEEEQPPAAEAPPKAAEEPPKAAATPPVSQEPPRAAETPAAPEVPQVMEALTEHYRRVSGVDWARTLDEPEQVLPKVAAAVTMQTLQAAAQALEHVLPKMLDVLLERRESQKTFRSRLTERYPQLRGKEAQVETLAAQVRQMFPSASADEMIEKVGAMAEVLFGAQPRRPAQRAPVPVGLNGKREEPTNPFADDSLWE